MGSTDASARRKLKQITMGGAKLKVRQSIKVVGMALTTRILEFKKLSDDRAAKA